MDPVTIGKDDVRRLLPMASCIRLMEAALGALAKGEAVQPLRSIMRLPDTAGLLGMMPAYAPALRMMSIKVISVFPQNRAAGHSSHQGAVLLFEVEHGSLLAILDAAEITAIRTAAVSGLATRLLARESASTLAVLGSGTQARMHVEAMLSVRNIASIKIWSRNPDRAAEFCAEVAAKYARPVVVARNPAEAIIDADVICTTTASPAPVVSGEWVKAGAHINAIGACTPGARELDTLAVLKSKLYTDRYDSLFNEAGDFIIPRSEGALNDGHVKGELGEVLSGAKKGRESDAEITLFKSLGIAIEDLYAAHHVYAASMNDGPK